MDNSESRMNPRFRTELEKGILWQPRVIESGREMAAGFDEEKKEKRRASVLSSLSLSWFSVISHRQVWYSPVCSGVCACVCVSVSVSVCLCVLACWLFFLFSSFFLFSLFCFLFLFIFSSFSLSAIRPFCSFWHYWPSNSPLPPLFSFGIQSTALEWFESYLSDRCQFTSVNNSSSPQSQLKYGVPQGSVLGTVLFVLYTTPLSLTLSRAIL